MKMWCCWEKQDVLSVFRRKVDSSYYKDIFLKPESLVRFVSFFDLNYWLAVLLVKEVFPSFISFFFFFFWMEDFLLPLLDSFGVSVTLLGWRELGRFLQDQEVLLLNKSQEWEDLVSWGLCESTKWEVRSWLFFLRVKISNWWADSENIYFSLKYMCSALFFFFFLVRKVGSWLETL